MHHNPDLSDRDSADGGLPERDGRLVENVVHFCRALRKAGVRVGTAQLETAIEAVSISGFTNRTDFYYTLRSSLIAHQQNLEVFHQVFSLFWRDPDFLQKMMFQLSPTLKDDSAPADKSAAQRRATDALGNKQDNRQRPQKQEVVKDAVFTISEQDVVRSKDFDQMTAEELREAEKTIQTLSFNGPKLTSRRQRPDPQGQITDIRGTLKTALRSGGEIRQIAHKSCRPKLANLVVICDISGSMSVYSKMIMRFLHALTHAPVRQWAHISTFTFGTRLTNVTRALHQRDPDIALSGIGRAATDWEGGTIIGSTLKQFNREWSRRVLSRNAVVLFISDGLERGDTDLLTTEIARLRLFCRQLVWLNPLLRWEGFSPQASGIRAILPHIDSLRACHSLDQLADLADALGNDTMGSNKLRDEMLDLVRRTSNPQ